MITIFKHIPRTGGTTIKELLPENNIFILGHDYYGEGYKHLYHHVQPYLKRFVLSFVRNPYDRAVSAFHYLNAGGNNPNDILSYEKYIEKYNGDFNEFVYNEFITIKFPEILYQIHFMPQHYWIYFGIEYINLCNYVGKFETLKEDIIELSKFIDLKDIGIPQQNRSEHGPYEEYYTPETKKAIYKYYREDFEFFNYEE